MVVASEGISTLELATPPYLPLMRLIRKVYRTLGIPCAASPLSKYMVDEIREEAAESVHDAYNEGWDDRDMLGT